MSGVNSHMETHYSGYARSQIIPSDAIPEEGDTIGLSIFRSPIHLI